MSTVTRPVMQMADTDVNAAWIRSAGSCERVAAGSMSSTVPTAMAPRYTVGITRVGWPSHRASRTRR